MAFLRDPIMSIAIAAFLRPFAALLVIGLIAAPIKYYVDRHMKNGKLKRFLLWKIPKT